MSVILGISIGLAIGVMLASAGIYLLVKWLWRRWWP